MKKVKEKEKMSDDKKTLNIKEIGKRMEDSISEYFYKSKFRPDPTSKF